MGRRQGSIAVASVILALPLSACAEVEEEVAGGYQPSKLEPIKGSAHQRVTFTDEGAERVGLKTAPIRRGSGHQVVVPYAALIYDPEGKTYVYKSHKRPSFVRAEVQVDRIDGDRVLLSRGPPAGTRVVTVGAAEVYGAELDIASG